MIKFQTRVKILWASHNNLYSQGGFGGYNMGREESQVSSCPIKHLLSS